MANFVLVHGSWHGAWAWDKLVPILEQHGHQCVAVDLPGRGKNPAPRAEQTMATYVRTVVEPIEHLDEPVYLVGHSAGGPVVSEVAERHPERVRALVFVTAFMLEDGQSILDIAGNDAGNEILPHAEMIENNQAMAVSKEGAIHALYGDCSAGDADWASDQLVAEATEPAAAAVKLTDDGFGSVPRYYIECLEDRAISNATQQQMIKASPPKKVFTLQSSHSPMLSQPDELARILLEIVSI